MFKRKTLLFIVIIPIFFFLSCSVKEIKVPVPVPTRCQVQFPQAPLSNTMNAEYLKMILEYTELLKEKLYFCINAESLIMQKEEKKN